MVAQAETGLIIPVPELEDFICSWREVTDAVPPVGVPAHVSLLYPYLEPGAVRWMHDEVEAFFAAVDPFDFELTSVGWFDRRVVFLRPDPDDIFIDLTTRLVGRWSQCVPYGGRHKEIVPHLTLGIEGSDEDMDKLAAAAQAMLPVRCRATEAWLMEGTARPAAWRVADKFPLGGRSD